jgi:hypothetical protein
MRGGKLGLNNFVRDLCRTSLNKQIDKSAAVPWPFNESEVFITMSLLRLYLKVC